MPTFDYHCDTCGRTAEQIRPWSDRDRSVRCGAGGCKGHLVAAPPPVPAPAR